MKRQVGRRRLRLAKELMADLLKAVYAGQGVVTSDAPDDLRVVGVAGEDDECIDLTIESAAYDPCEIEGAPPPYEIISYNIELFRAYPPDPYEQAGDE